MVIFDLFRSLYLPDSVRHNILDGVQPRDDLGLAGVVLRAGLLLQLRHRRPVRGLSVCGAHAAHFLVHRYTYCEFLLWFLRAKVLAGQPVSFHRAWPAKDGQCKRGQI